MAPQVPKKTPIALEGCHEMVPWACPGKSTLFLLDHERIVHQGVIKVLHGEDWESILVILHIA